MKNHSPHEANTLSSDLIDNNATKTHNKHNSAFPEVLKVSNT